MSNSNSSSISIPKFILTSYDLPPLTINILIPTPIGIPFPLPVKFKQKIDFEILPFEINGKFNFKVLPSASATLGARFVVNEGWSNISTYNFNATTPSSFTYSDYLTNGSINAQLTIFNPKYSISPMFVDELKATLEFPTKLNLKVQGNRPNYSLKGTVDAKGEISQKFFRNLQGNYSITANLFTKTILEGNWNTSIVGTWKHISTYWCGICISCIPEGQTVMGNCGGGYNGDPLCNWQYSLTFNENLTGIHSAVCNNPSKNFTYTINNTQTILSVNFSNEPIQNFEILELSSTTLKIKELNYSDPDILTFQRQ